MYSLHLVCEADELEIISTDLWEVGTCGIRELDLPDGRVELIAGFERNDARESLLRMLSQYSPRWTLEADTDWIAETRRSWPGRNAGTRFFLAPLWCEEPTQPGRIRLVHNPGLACGTGEHPCTRLALEALERTVGPESRVADIGTGSGILAIATLQLGARSAVGVDLDEAALQAARENFALNQLAPAVVAGSADCLLSQCFDVVVANISPSVLLAISDDLLRVVKLSGTTILTGFQDIEADTIAAVFPPETTLTEEGWCCLISRVSE